MQAEHANEEHDPCSRRFREDGGIAPGRYVDSRGDSGQWDDIEHVGPGMPTTWDVVVDHDNSQNMCAEDDIGLGLALNGHSFYQ